jgi:hypothetical protein
MSLIDGEPYTQFTNVNILGQLRFDGQQFSLFPQGPDDAIQFKESGVLAGTSNLAWDNDNDTFSVTGISNLDGETNIFGDTTINSNFGVVGDVAIDGEFIVDSMNINFDGIFDIVGATSVTGAFGVTGASIFDGNVGVLGDLGITGTFSAGSLGVSAADTEVLFSNAGVIDGDPDFTFNGLELFVNGSIVATTFNDVALTDALTTVDYLAGDGSYQTLPAPGTPAGADGNIQFALASAFASDNNLAWDGSSLNAPEFNGVALSSDGSGGNYLGENGNYITIPVNSVFGRGNAITAQQDDYSSTLIDNLSVVIGDDVTTALDTLDFNKLDSVVSGGFPISLDETDPQNPIINTTVLSGEYRLGTVNGTVTPLSLNTPAKALTGGNDVGVALNGVTKPVDNRLQITLTETSTVEVGASCSWDKSGGGTNQYRMHIYQDGNPMAVPLFQDFELGGIDIAVMLQGSVENLSSGTYYFEVWIEGQSDGDDITMETGQAWIRRKY